MKSEKSERREKEVRPKTQNKEVIKWKTEKKRTKDAEASGRQASFGPIMSRMSLFSPSFP